MISGVQTGPRQPADDLRVAYQHPWKSSTRFFDSVCPELSETFWSSHER